MNSAELRLLIRSAAWFSKIGEPDYTNIKGYVTIPNLDDWQHVTGRTANEPVPRLIEQGMEWLPTQRDQPDPVHGQSLKADANASGKTSECSALALELCTEVLAALRHVDSLAGFRSGPNDFTNAARGGALFAARNAAYEAVLGKPNFWCRMASVYHSGHWPCGVLPDRAVVVL